MGTTQVKLYNKTLEERKTMELETSKLMYITVDENDEDFFYDLPMRKQIVLEMLGKCPSWSDAHDICATANCGEWYKYNPKYNNFYKE